MMSLEPEAAGSDADSEGPARFVQVSLENALSPAATVPRPGDGVHSGDGAPPGECVPPGDGVGGVPPGGGVKKRHVRSFVPSDCGKAKRGRPASKACKTCGLCGAKDHDEDPTQVEYENTKVAHSGDSRNDDGKLAIRWLYPRTEGMAQGNFCYYCGKTGELAYPDLPMKHIKESVTGSIATGSNEAESKVFFQRRNALIEHVAKTGSFRDLKDVVEAVVLEQSKGNAYSHRGHLMSVRKYKQNTGKAPDPSHVISATSRSGKRKDVVKVYDHADSSSWSFSETEATKVCMKRALDSGKSC